MTAKMNLMLFALVKTLLQSYQLAWGIFKQGIQAIRTFLIVNLLSIKVANKKSNA